MCFKKWSAGMWNSKYESEYQWVYFNSPVLETLLSIMSNGTKIVLTGWLHIMARLYRVFPSDLSINTFPELHCLLFFSVIFSSGHYTVYVQIRWWWVLSSNQVYVHVSRLICGKWKQISSKHGNKTPSEPTTQQY